MLHSLTTKNATTPTAYNATKSILCCRVSVLAYYMKPLHIAMIYRLFHHTLNSTPVPVTWPSHSAPSAALLHSRNLLYFSSEPSRMWRLGPPRISAHRNFKLSVSSYYSEGKHWKYSRGWSFIHSLETAHTTYSNSF